MSFWYINFWAHIDIIEKGEELGFFENYRGEVSKSGRWSMETLHKSLL